MTMPNTETMNGSFLLVMLCLSVSFKIYILFSMSFTHFKCKSNIVTSKKVKFIVKSFLQMDKYTVIDYEIDAGQGLCLEKVCEGRGGVSRFVKCLPKGIFLFLIDFRW